MKRSNTSKGTIFVTVMTIGLCAGQALAQQADDLVGRWILVSNDTVGNFGPHPKGELMFDASGHFMLLNGRSDLPKFAAGNRVSGTPEENKAIVQGSIALYGTYSVELAAVSRLLVFNIEYSTYPNWDGEVQKRPFTLEGDKLSYTVLPTATGGGTAHIVWQRAK